MPIGPRPSREMTRGTAMSNKKRPNNFHDSDVKAQGFLLIRQTSLRMLQNANGIQRLLLLVNYNSTSFGAFNLIGWEGTQCQRERQQFGIYSNCHFTYLVLSIKRKFRRKKLYIAQNFLIQIEQASLSKVNLVKDRPSFMHTTCQK